MSTTSSPTQTASPAASITSSGCTGCCCTCCHCGYFIDSDDDLTTNDNAHDLCIVEGSFLEKSKSLEKHEMSEVVWRNVKPPTNFGMYQTAVSARRMEILRSELTRKMKPAQDTGKVCSKAVCKTPPCRATGNVSSSS